MNTILQSTLENVVQQSISEERKLVLQPLVAYIQNQVDLKQAVRLNFICTHNSRRSHLSQIWAQTMAYYYQVPNVICYSGGTENTALFYKVAETLEKQGFELSVLAQNDSNPIYSIKYDNNELAIIGFSKTYDAEFNPTSDFAAILTCSQADEGCPFIAGASKRISIPYLDPKAYDNTELMDEKYLAKSIEIATEMNYVFSKIRYEK